MCWSSHCLLCCCLCVLTQCRSLRVWVCGGPPCHQLKPREVTISVTFPTAFSMACFACSAPSSDPGTEIRLPGYSPAEIVLLNRKVFKKHFRPRGVNMVGLLWLFEGWYWQVIWKMIHNNFDEPLSGQHFLLTNTFVHDNLVNSGVVVCRG